MERAPTTGELCRRLAQRPPALPTLLAALPARPVQFQDLHGLALHVHRLRAGRGLRLARAIGAAAGPILNLYVVHPDDGGEDWLCAVAVQGRSVEAVQDALRAAEPETGLEPGLEAAA